MVDVKHIRVKTEDEMISQLKILLNNGYNVAISKHVNVLNLEKDDVTYQTGTINSLAKLSLNTINELTAENEKLHSELILLQKELANEVNAHLKNIFELRDTIHLTRINAYKELADKILNITGPIYHQEVRNVLKDFIVNDES